MKKIMTILFALVAIATGAQASTYKLWLTDRQVTDANLDDVLGDGTVTFNPLTNVLTLTGTDIVTDSNLECAIYNYFRNEAVPGDIEVKNLTIMVMADSRLSTSEECLCFYGTNVTITGPGKLTMTSSDEDAVSMTDGTLTISEADIMAKGRMCAFYGQGSTLIVDHATLNAYSNFAQKPTIRMFKEMQMRNCQFADVDYDYCQWDAGNFYYDNDAMAISYSGNYYDMQRGTEYWDGTYEFKVIIEPTWKSYDLKVANITVTDDNKDDILGDGTAMFDSRASTLIFTNANITNPKEVYSTYCVEDGMKDLTIRFEGNNKLTSSTGKSVITSYGYTPEQLHLTGSGTVELKGSTGIGFSGSILDINGGLQLTAEGTERGLSGSATNTTLYISGKNTMVRAYGNRPVSLFKSLELKDDIYIVEPVVAWWDGSASCVKDLNGNVMNQWVTFKAPYRLWVKDVQVTYGNKNDILGDKKVRYNSERNRLILNGVDITYDRDCIYNEIDDLTIDFWGESTLESTGEERAAIYNNSSNGRLTLSGDGNASLIGEIGIIACTPNISTPAEISIEGGLALNVKSTGPAGKSLAAISTGAGNVGSISISGNATELTLKSNYKPIAGFYALNYDGDLEFYNPAGAYFDADSKSIKLSNGTEATTETVTIRMPNIDIVESNFPDAEFRRCLTNLFGKNYITPADLREYEEYELSAEGIADLTGIHYFNMNTGLYFSANQVKTADLSACKKLINIEAEMNQISGTDMDYFVEHLPMTKDGTLSIYYHSSSSKYPEANEMTPEQVAIANAKGWTVLVENYRDYKYGNWDETKGFWRISEERFPDEAFRNYLEDCDFRCMGALTFEDVEETTDLEPESRGIKDLTGVEYFTELAYITVSDNELTTIDFSNNMKLRDASCCRNQIRGEGMDKLIESLPTLPESEKAYLYVIDDDSDYPETNVITNQQVAKAKAKGWLPMTYDYDQKTWVEITEAQATAITTVGSDRPNGTFTYTIGGQHIPGQPTQKGFYISGGRKVVVK